MIKTILRAENLVKSYKVGKDKQLNILKGISIEIQENKITTIIGASGAGKSTLLHILSGLDKADSGDVYFFNRKFSDMKQSELAKFRNQNLGFVFQFHHLLPEFTALENVAIPLMINKISRQKSFEKSQTLLQMVGLSERVNNKPAELSGGEQQRVALARALVNDPKIILADEPTGNLDSENSESIGKLFIKIRDELKGSLVIVTHNPELVKIADQVYEMFDGKLKNN
ncbi:MAG: ABC transporter ATP-binding protein [Ignavibacteriales bacterium]|nr:ABC transporter ATP-binding protein [Ignavibacteriales bacterium]